MQNVRRRPLSRRKCNYLRVHEIQNKSLLTVTTTPPFCATIPPVRSSSDTNYFMRQSGARPLLPTIIIRSTKVHHLKSTAIPCPLNCIQPTKPADRLYKSQAADGLALLLYTISEFNCAICLAPFHSEIVIISLDTPFPPASAQSGTVPPP